MRAIEILNQTIYFVRYYMYYKVYLKLSEKITEKWNEKNVSFHINSATHGKLEVSLSDFLDIFCA